MSRPRYTTAFLFLLCARLLAACGGGTATTTTGGQAGPTATTASPRTDTAAVPTQAPTQVAAVPDVPEATEEPEEPVGSDSGGGAEPTEQKPTAQPRQKPRSTAAPKPTIAPTPASDPTAQEPVATQPSAAKPGLPVRFRIDTSDVKVDATVEHVAFAPNSRAMDVPKKWENVAWFEPGYRPGTPGNAVLAGHFDSDTGPAVFYKLQEIKVGDIVSVEDNEGNIMRFRVTKAQSYFDEDAPLYEIFGPSDEPHLNLITCDGEFDPKTKRYDKKFVVFTEMMG
ncbi:MAG: sortase [Chloroflexota bacterium]|nr:sortase [Chloroflexota bacterium]